MRITGLETVRIAGRPTLLRHLVHADEGVTGPGETVLGAATVEAQVHERIAPGVLGRVRAVRRTWYRDLLTALPEVRDGMTSAPPGPGLGLGPGPDLGRAPTVTRRRSEAATL